jgi:hypothetical protein
MESPGHGETGIGRPWTLQGNRLCQAHELTASIER